MMYLRRIRRELVIFNENHSRRRELLDSDVFLPRCVRAELLVIDLDHVSEIIIAGR